MKKLANEVLELQLYCNRKRNLTPIHLRFNIFQVDLMNRHYPMPGHSPSKACPCLTQCHRQVSTAPKGSLVIVQEVSIDTDAILLL